MAIGNEDIGLNVWVESNGDLLFYIGKTDAWSENGRLRVRFSPNPVVNDTPFQQELQLRLRVWVDANHPVIYVEVKNPTPVNLQACLEIWRDSSRTISQESPEIHSAYGLMVNPGSLASTFRMSWRNQTPSSAVRGSESSGITTMSLPSGKKTCSCRHGVNSPKITMIPCCTALSARLSWDTTWPIPPISRWLRFNRPAI